MTREPLAGSTMGMELQVLGGSGEQGRACFAVVESGVAALLDAGVKRTPTAAPQDIYPRFETLRAEPCAVLLSHAHEDHAAALPLLQRHVGAPVPVYTTDATVPVARAACATWRSTVAGAGEPSPYDAAEVERVPFRAISHGATASLGGTFRFTFGAAGHVPGSSWILVEAGGRRLLYTGDWSSESYLLQAPDFPRDVDAVLLDASYGDQVFSQEEQAAQLLQRIAAVAAGGGSVLLPLPRIGRGQEILLLLGARAAELPPVHVEEALVAGLEAYRGADELAAEGRARLEAFDVSRVRVFAADSPGQVHGPAVFLATDGMLARGAAVELYHWLAPAPPNLVVLTGYQAPGTLGRRLLEGPRPGECGAERVTWKVHPDFGETRALLAGLGGRPAVYAIHAEAPRAAAAAAAIEALGYEARVLAVGDSCDVG